MRCHCDNAAVVATLIKTGDQQVSYGNETNPLLVCVRGQVQCGVGSRACARGGKRGSKCTVAR